MNSSNQTYEFGQVKYLEFDKAIVKVTRILPMVFVVVGTITNSLTVAAMTSSRTKKSSFTVYLTALAIFDTIMLYMWPFDYWLRAMFGFKMEDSSNLMCKLRFVCLLVCKQMSAWMIVALTIERTCCTFFPVRFHTVCGPKAGYIVVTVSLLIAFAKNTHVWYGFQLTDVGNTIICHFINKRYAHVYRRYLPWIDTVVCFLIPALIIILFNSATVWKVYRTKRALINGRTGNNSKHVAYILIITLLVSVAFLVLVGPFSIFIIVRYFVMSKSNFMQSATSNAEQVVQVVTHTLVHINHAGNFFLYVISGKKFRQDLKRALWCRSEGKGRRNGTSAERSRKIAREVNLGSRTPKISTNHECTEVSVPTPICHM